MPDDETWNDEDEREEEQAPSGSERAPTETQRENAYLKELVQNETEVVVKLRSGEQLTGYIEYYDKRFIRLTREGAPNLFIFKKDIKYLHEAQPGAPRPAHRPRS